MAKVIVRIRYRRRVTRVVRSRPAPTRTSEERELGRRRMRLLVFAGLVLILGATGSGVYLYIESAPRRAAAVFREGVSLMTPANYHLAVERFNRALEIAPDLEEAYVQRGLAYQYQGQMQAAMQDYEHALALNPRNGEVLTARGIIYRNRRELSKAIDEFSKVIELRHDTDAYYERAQAYEAIGEHAKAIADFDKVIQDLQDAPHALRARAFAKRRMGDEAGYQADIDRAVALEVRGVKNSLK